MESSGRPSGVNDQRDFGAALRTARLAAGLSLNDFSRAVNYSKGQISKVENGVAKPTSELARASDALLGTGQLLQDLMPTGTGVGRRTRTPVGFFSGLPRDTRYFTGRADELAQVVAALRPGSGRSFGPRICVVHGMPGVGKTALAVRAADRLEEVFPDGTVFMDLHGYTPKMDPVLSADALDRCLRRLGVSGEHIPSHEDDRAGLLRDRLASVRMLLVLDNAASQSQVEPLLPSDPRCAVLITSRDRLAGLDDAVHLELDVLPAPDAVGLFRAVAAQSSSGSPPTGVADDVVDLVVRCCGLLPLTVRIAAARLRKYREAELSELVERVVAREIGGLNIVDDGKRTVMETFDASLIAVPPEHSRVFTTMAHHPGADFGPFAASAMTGLPRPDLDSVLDRLCDAHLLVRGGTGRFRFHDVVREYAVSVADATEVAAAHRRLIDYSVVLTQRADRLIAPHRHHRPLPPDQVSAHLEPALPTRGSALQWLTDEFDNLVEVCRLAADQTEYEQCWRISHALQGFAFLTKAWDVWTATQSVGLAAARRLGDREAEGYLLNGLGLVYLERHDADRAEEQFRAAGALFDAIGDERGQSTTSGNWAWVHQLRGDHLRSLRAHRRAFEFHANEGNEVSAAVVLRGMAVAEIGLGRADAAVDRLRAASRTFEQHGSALDLVMTLNCLGEAHQASGDLQNAAGAYRQAIDRSEACGSRYEHARGLEGLATVLDDRSSAVRYLRLASHVYSELGAPEAARVRAVLGPLTSQPHLMP